MRNEYQDKNTLLQNTEYSNTFKMCIDSQWLCK